MRPWHERLQVGRDSRRCATPERDGSSVDRLRPADLLRASTVGERSERRPRQSSRRPVVAARHGCRVEDDVARSSDRQRRCCGRALPVADRCRPPRDAGRSASPTRSAPDVDADDAGCRRRAAAVSASTRSSDARDGADRRSAAGARLDRSSDTRRRTPWPASARHPQSELLVSGPCGIGARLSGDVTSASTCKAPADG